MRFRYFSIVWRSLRPGQRRRLGGMLRVFSYLLFVSLVGTLLAASRVYARVGDATLRAGRELDRLGDVLGNTKTVYVNGAAMNISSAFTDQSAREVLDRFEAVCREHPGALVRALSDVPATLLDRAKVDGR
ncbi:MAG: hypothetical protein JOZ69_11980, partial [Myxococcales bacterium]|nr:hypothetical protein [Myxococcales bacterium]